MRIRILRLLDAVGSSYWFVPSLMTLAAALLSGVMVTVDARTDPKWVEGLTWIYINGPEGARALLSTVAGSMMTVAGVTFSIVMVVLSLTSSQFGPRLLRNFMRDTGNQVVLGTFVATFIYCLLVLRTVHGADEGNVFVPHLSLALAVVLAILSLGVFIYFIHHTAESIQISHIIAEIASLMEHTISSLYPDPKLFPDRLGQDSSEVPPEGTVPGLPEEDAARVATFKSGYFQRVNEEGLMQFAKDHQVLLEISPRPGAFVMKGSPLVRVWPKERCDETFEGALKEQFSFGAHRTHSQDLEFLFDQLVEVALRALSPGINDHFTAISCIDRIGEGLNLLANRDLPSAYRYDEEGVLRIITPPVNLNKLVENTFGPIRRYSKGSLLVGEHLLHTIKTLLGLTEDATLHEALLKQARLVRQDGCKALNEEDGEILERAYREVIAARP